MKMRGPQVFNQSPSGEAWRGCGGKLFSQPSQESGFGTSAAHNVFRCFTAMAVLLLMDEGRVRLDDRLSKFFPDFGEFANRITIRHLLNHTSGLPDYEALMTGKLKIDPETASRGKNEVSLDEVVAAIGKEPMLRFEPGEKWEYSNCGYFLLSRIVEKASGQSFPEFLKARIFDPLQMTNSFVYDDERLGKTPQRAWRYYKEWHGIKPGDASPMLKFLVGGGGIYPTAEDLAKWDAALYTDKLAKQSTLKEAFTQGELNDGSAADPSTKQSDWLRNTCAKQNFYASS
jgi:CubicO group peptidase (beta-lactamase class C family)